MAIASASKTLYYVHVLCATQILISVVKFIVFYCVYFITGTAVKKVGRDVMDKDFVYIYSVVFNYICDLLYCAQETGRERALHITAPRAPSNGFFWQWYRYCFLCMEAGSIAVRTPLN